MKIKGNTILITGGGSGIGRGLAESFLALGNKVLIAGRNEKKLQEVVRANPGMEAVALDVSSEEEIFKFSASLIETYPSLNVLINNAGMMQVENVLDHKLQIAEDTITTNLLGPIRLTAALLPHLQKQPQATIMNVTSGLAFVPLFTTPTYCATKAALHSYSLSLREQLSDTKINVVEIAPPYVQTHLTGDRQAVDPRAMPLQEYIKEVMNILTTQEDVEEVLVERVKPLRNAESNGTFKEIFHQLIELGKDRAAN